MRIAFVALFCISSIDGFLHQYDNLVRLILPIYTLYLITVTKDTFINIPVYNIYGDIMIQKVIRVDEEVWGELLILKVKGKAKTTNDVLRKILELE